MTGAIDVFQVSFEGSTVKHPQATVLLAAGYDGNAVDAWAYPAGGTALKTVTGITGPEGAIESP